MSNLRFPFLRAKLHQPLPAPSLVRRERLLKMFLDRPETTLVLLVASAGSGKTTLIVQWLEHLSYPVAWLSLDETDDDLVVFLSYLTAAIQSVFPEACSLTQKLIATPQPPPVGYLVTTLANELSDIGQPFALVLDDYHCLRQAAIHHFVSQLVRHAPANLRLVISSRFDPPLQLSRLAAQGRLVEIRAADLRFRLSEAQALLEQAAGVPLPTERIDAVVEEMEGWAAGLQSSALSLRSAETGSGSRDDRLPRDHRHLAGILADEVFATQAADVRNFLIRTSVLNQLTAPLCQALFADDMPGVTTPPDSQAVLQQLARENVFIETLDADQRWYRYHNLFRLALLRRLKQTCRLAEINMLHRRASIWHWNYGSADEALRHALAAQDAALAADIVEANLHELLRTEQWVILERWVNALPAETVQQRPHLLVAQAWVYYFHFRVPQLSPLLAQARSALEQGTAPAAARAMVRCHVETLSTLVYFAGGDYPGATQAAQRALAEMEPGDYLSRGFALFFQAMSLFALRGLDEAVALSSRFVDDRLEDVTVRARALLSLCHMYGLACRPLEQERTARALLKLAQGHDLDVSMAWAHRHLGSAYFERYELDLAVHHFSLVVEQPYLAHFVCARDCFIGLALAYLAQQRADDAAAVASRLQTFYIDRGLTSLPEFDSFRARFAFLSGDIDQALQVLAAGQPSRLALPMIAYETVTLTRTMIQVVAGSAAQRRAAMADLAELQRLAEHSHSTWHLIHIRVLQAVALHLDGQTEKALDVLHQAVLLGYPGRVVAALVEVGAPLKHLLQRMVEHDVQPAAYIRELVAVCAPGEAVRSPVMPGADLMRVVSDETFVEPLSSRELEVLVLVSQRLPNKEIAARLVISPLTVKRHMTNIMQKLGVETRWDAVERAREIGLLPSR